MSKSLDALLQSPASGSWTLRSPTVGIFRSALRKGDQVRGGTLLGHLKVLGDAIPLHSPATRETFLVTQAPKGLQASEYGSELFQIVNAAILQSGAQATGDASQVDSDLPPDAEAIPSAIDGMFYRSASPDDPAFVQEGDLIKPGQVIGLVEVMKFFYEIKYERADLGEVRVHRIDAKDAASIDAGDVILYVVPA